MSTVNKIYFVSSFIISAIFCFAKVPLGFSVLGNEPHPLCGEISMPADWTDLTELENWTFTPDTAAKNKGYIVFSRHYMTETTPNSLPLEYEVGKELKAFASLGEYEPMTFLIRTLQPLQNFQVKVSDLINADGDKLDQNKLDLRFALALPFKSAAHNTGYTNRHEILVSEIPKSLATEQTYLFWLTVYVPIDCKEGIYKGKVSITTKDSTEELPLSFRVFPIALQENPNQERGMYIGGHQRQKSERRHFYLDMKEHGMNTVAPCNFSVPLSWRDNKIQLDFALLDREIELYREAGFTMPFTVDMRPIEAWLIMLQNEMTAFKKAGKEFPATHPVRVGSFDVNPTYSDFEEESYRQIVRQIVAYAEANNYPPLYFMAQEESTNKGVRIQILQRFSKLLKEEGVTVAAWSNGTWSRGNSDDLHDIDEYIDVRYYNFVEPKVYNRTKKSGDFFGIFNHGNRLMYGFFGQKVKAEGMLQWAYNWGVTRRMLSDGTGSYGSGLVYIGDVGPLPSPRWEMIREGYDDSRYIFTLESLIAELKEKNLAADMQKKLKAAEATLQEIFDLIPDVTTEMNQLQKETNPAQYDIWRYKIIREILELQNAILAKAPAKQNNAFDDSTVKLFAGNYPLAGKKKIEKKEEVDAPSLIIPYHNAEINIDDLIEDKWQIKPAVIDKLQLIGQQRLGRARAVAADAESIHSVQVDPFQKTSVKLFYNDEALFIYFDCVESEMHKILANAKNKEDRVFADDIAELFVKPNPNIEEYYQIAINSLGVYSTLHWYQDGVRRIQGKAWQPDLQTRGKSLANSWRTVVRIPFAELGLQSKPLSGALWYLNAAREQQPTPGTELSTWGPTYISFHEVFRWGKLYFSEVPTVLIEEVELESAVFGDNLLKIRLLNNSNKAQQGTLKIISLKNLEVAESLPWTCTAKEQTLELPFKIIDGGDLEMNLVLLDTNGNTLYTSFLTEEILPIMSAKLQQFDFNENLLALPLNLNINQENLMDYELKLAIATENFEKSAITQLKYSGEQEFVINLESFSAGKYNLQLQLNDKKGKLVAQETLSFELIKNEYF